MRRSLAGPRDNNSYRSNAQYGHKVQETSITYEGILNEYSYNIGEEFDELFNTSYSCAVAKNVVNGELEHYLCLEMKSKMDGDGLQRNGGRPPMNFSFVLDVSGSMNSSFGRGDEQKSKLAVAQECLINLLSKMQPKDRFGLILFTEKAQTLIPIGVVEELDMSDIKSKILATTAGGGTSIMAGMNAAEEMLSKYKIEPAQKNQKHNMNRIFFLTDMNPSDDRVDLVSLGHRLSSQGIFISLIGIGVDFNSDLAYKFAQVKGCNSFSVSSAAQFRKQMSEDFDYSSMLICYNVSLKMTSDEFDVEEVYGSPAVPDRSIGEVLKVDSICPSPNSSEGGIKGGAVVLKLKRKNPEKTCGDDFKLNLSYIDWEDTPHKVENVFHFPEDPKEPEGYFQNSTVRKAVALCRYVKLMKQVIKNDADKEKNKELLTTFKQHLVSEMQALNDTSTEKEILMLDTFINKEVPQQLNNSNNAIHYRRGYCGVSGM